VASKTLLVWVAGVVLMAVGCGGGGGGQEGGGGEETSGGEGAGASYEGAITSTDAAHGKELFAKFCDDCHPDGQEDVGPSLIDEPHTPARIRQQVREGSGKMRPFSEKRISGEDLEALLAYLASINAVK